MRYENTDDLSDEELEKWKSTPADQSQEALNEVDEELEKHELEIVMSEDTGSDCVWRIDKLEK